MNGHKESLRRLRDWIACLRHQRNGVEFGGGLLQSRTRYTPSQTRVKARISALEVTMRRTTASSAEITWQKRARRSPYDESSSQPIVNTWILQSPGRLGITAGALLG